MSFNEWCACVFITLNLPFGSYFLCLGGTPPGNNECFCKFVFYYFYYILFSSFVYESVKLSLISISQLIFFFAEIVIICLQVFSTIFSLVIYIIMSHYHLLCKTYVFYIFLVCILQCVKCKLHF